MKNFFKKYKIYLGIAGYMLFLAGIAFFAIKPLILRINDQNNKIQEKIAEQENKKEKLEKIPAIREQFDKIKESENEVNIILTKDNIVDLIKKIEKISEDTGNKVKIEVVDDVNKKVPTKAKKDEKESLLEKIGNQEYVAMNINLAGNYQNLLDFISKMENTEYYSDIISVKMTEEGKKNTNQANPFEVAESEINTGDNIIFSTLAIIFYLKK